MKSTVISQRCSSLLIALVLTLTYTMSAYASQKESGTRPTLVPRSKLSVEPGPTTQMAAEISQDLGKVIASGKGGANRIVIVFEETHISRLGQLEIALMLIRLYNKHTLRQVALEGAIFDNGHLPAKWFHDLTITTSTKRAGQETAVRLLKEGEITAAEFMALAIPDVQVRGNEKASEYDVKLSDEASGASTGYLIAIAEKSLTENQIRQANQMIQDKKEHEAVEFIIGNNAWTKEHYQKLTSQESILSSEELTTILEEIEVKANAVGAEISPEDRAGLREEITFFKTATKRSYTMVENTFVMCDRAPKSPVALIIGAAHTPTVVARLKAGNASYAVISPSSLAISDKIGTLTTPAYRRKNDLKSVDAPDLLGAYLDNRHKPPTNLAKQWLHSKSEIYLVARLLAVAAAGGEKPPFNSLQNELKALRSIKMDPSSYQVIKKNDQNRIMFKVIARTDDSDPNRTVEIWVGSWNEPPKPPDPPISSVPGQPEEKDPDSLERLLQEAREEAKKEKNENVEQEQSPQSGEIAILPISRNTKAVFSTKQAAVKNVIERG